MLRGMTSRELTAWMAFDRLAPFGSSREDVRASVIAATVANGTRPRRDRPWRPSDFGLIDDGKPASRGGDWRAWKAALKAAS